VKLKELQIKKGISQVKLAMDLHLTQNSISRYENNQREADYETLIRIADYFDVSLDELLECDYPLGGSKQNKP
jgi:transcriptional regulator with XRE-family HTH domain